MQRSACCVGIEEDIRHNHGLNWYNGPYAEFWAAQPVPPDT